MRALGAALAALALSAALASCGSAGHPARTSAKLRRADGGIPPSLLAQERPIGRGARFHPPATGPVPGVCSATLGPRLRAHLEVFGADRVVLLAAGIGTRPPRRSLGGRIVHARCFGDVVTLDPTGIVYFRPGVTVTVADVFRAWGQRLTPRRTASFTGGRVAVYVDGRRRPGDPRALVLRDGAEIVLEIGPRVPPHPSFTFPASPSPRLR